ncbi:hypothetical protein [Chryseobacterium sp. 2VB]|uniref:hypothetical protein n=1 Tax=Chryseobacterium sp. 2VB TaxID=2502204 RepID=UPI0014857144|nr:hypothetical protein [Chryseobacterium sp. 2VB]
MINTITKESGSSPEHKRSDCIDRQPGKTGNQRTVAGESAYEVDKERIVYNTMLE